jgi:hypothetical protein
MDGTPVETPNLKMMGMKELAAYAIRSGINSADVAGAEDKGQIIALINTATLLKGFAAGGKKARDLTEYTGEPSSLNVSMDTLHFMEPHFHIIDTFLCETKLPKTFSNFWASKDILRLRGVGDASGQMEARFNEGRVGRREDWEKLFDHRLSVDPEGGAAAAAHAAPPAAARAPSSSPRTRSV